MDEFVKVSAKTVEDAILEASIQLGTTSDNIEYHILERETKGFLGIGAKKAMIEARRKVSEEEFINEVMHEKESKSSKKSAKKEADAEKASGKAEKKADKKADKKSEKSGKEASKGQKKEQKGAKKDEKEQDKEKVKKEAKEPTEEKAKKKAQKTKKETAGKDEEPLRNETAAAQAPIETAAAGSAQEMSPAAETEKEKAPESSTRVPADPEVVKSRAMEFLSQMLSAMGVEAEIETVYEDGVLSIDLKGEDMGVLIGKRGQTLDSIQYLTSLVVNKGKAAYVRVKIDTENYRERRKATLENLAKNMAFKVKKTGRPAYLEPMNPYERRIIHSALQNDPYVTTHSEGEEPARKVVITLRKREKEELPEE